jgi:hypothetical protein
MEGATVFHFQFRVLDDCSEECTFMIKAASFHLVQETLPTTGNHPYCHDDGGRSAADISQREHDAGPAAI